MAAQTLKLAERPHVIVATPGRLLDHLDGPSPPALRNLRFLVLDEAGRILSTGFAPELTRVLKSLPPLRAAADAALQRNHERRD